MASSRSASPLDLLGPSLQLFEAAVARTTLRDPVGVGSITDILTVSCLLRHIGLWLKLVSYLSILVYLWLSLVLVSYLYNLHYLWLRTSVLSL